MDNQNENVLNGAEVGDVVNKRVDFSKRTMRRVETMIPLYASDLKSPTSSKELSYIIEKAIDALFETDFKQRLDGI